MTVRFRIMIALLTVLAIGALVMTPFFYRWILYTKTETALKNGIGISWKDNITHNDKRKTYEIDYVSTGIVHTDPAIIVHLDMGDVVARIWNEALYIDSNGKAQKVFVPHLIEMPDHRLFLYNNQDPIVTWDAHEIAKQVRSDPEWFGGVKGIVMSTSIAPEIDAFIEPYIKNLSEPARYFYSIVRAYNAQKKIQLKKFISWGDPEIKFLLPVGKPSGIRKVVMLP